MNKTEREFNSLINIKIRIIISLNKLIKKIKNEVEKWSLHRSKRNKERR